VKTYSGFTNVVTTTNQSKCPATAMVTHSAEATYEQHIRDCLLVLDVFDLLVTAPDGYENMLLQDTAHICINGNDEDTFYVKKSALFVEATCDDEGKYFQLLVS
jgi:hypothetical protein